MRNTCQIVYPAVYFFFYFASPRRTDSCHFCIAFIVFRNAEMPHTVISHQETEVLVMVVQSAMNEGNPPKSFSESAYTGKPFLTETLFTEARNGAMSHQDMVKQNAIKIFEEKKVRTLWDSDTEEWHFSKLFIFLLKGLFSFHSKDTGTRSSCIHNHPLKRHRKPPKANFATSRRSNCGIA